MRFGHNVYVVPQTRLRQHFSQTRCKFFGVGFDREENDCVLFLGVRSVLLKKLQQLPQKRTLVLRSLSFGGVFGPQLNRQKGSVCCGQQFGDFFVLEVTVVNEAFPPSAAQQKGTVFNGAQSKHVNDGEGVFGDRVLSVPLFEVVERDAFLLQCSSDEGEFVLFGLACNKVALPQQTFLGCDQRHFAARSFGQKECEQRTLRYKSFVAEGKHFPLIDDIANLLAVRQQTRKYLP